MLREFMTNGNHQQSMTNSGLDAIRRKHHNGKLRLNPIVQTDDSGTTTTAMLMG
jgi:hypothetical protein